MCVEYCVKISDKSDKKLKSYSIYNLSSLMLLPVVIFERAATHWSEGREWGNGVWAHLKEEEPRNTVTLSFFAIYC